MAQPRLLLFLASLFCSTLLLAGSKPVLTALDQRAVLFAQKLMQEHREATAARRSVQAKAPDTQESFQLAHARALLSTQGLKKRQPASSDDPIYESPLPITQEQVYAAQPIEPMPTRLLASEAPPLSSLSLLFIALLGLFAGLAVAYLLFMRPEKSLIQLSVPGDGEHFTVRRGTKNGVFILDIMDVRGNLVRTAGTLRPHSVARAAVLPPELAAQLGAKGAFDRFELTALGVFIPTEKEEGYQVFPFVL